MTSRAPDAATAPATAPGSADLRELVALDFAGLDGGSAELTWGQRFVWDILESLAPDNHFISLRLRVRLPPDATRERVLGALHTLVQRHEVLRTRFTEGQDGEPRQLCDGTGVLPVEVVRTVPGRVRRVAEQEEQRLWHEPFVHGSEWPLRTSIVVAEGRPRQVVFVFSHLSVDAWGCTVLRGEFLELLRNTQATPALAGWQSRARAAFEQSAPARRANDASLAYWRRMLETAPQTAFPNLPAAGETPLFPGVGLTSAALAAAARAVAGRLRVSPAAAVLGALATVIGIRSGTDAVPLVLAAGNRFTPVDSASVGTFYQGAPALVRLDAGSLARTVKAAHQASALAYLRGQSDPRDVARLMAETATARGVSLGMLSTVNVAPEPGTAGPPPALGAAGLRELTAQTEVTDLEGRDKEQLKLYFHVKALRSRAVIELFSDSRLLDAASARKVLAGLEIVLIELFEAGDLTRERVAELVGVSELAVPEPKVVIDHCRIDLDAVRALLADLPEVTASDIFVERADNGDGDGAADNADANDDRLVAYLVTAAPTTPEHLHTALLDRLDGNLTMTPHRYVLCRDAPPRPGTRADWQRQPVIQQGSGRPGGGAAARPPAPTPSTDARLGA
ncbi:condensation domain-containing protein [Actinacidiphila bryophytorum]|uniref:condensation domain-containing protein n=1 Tax=Actinacidiphila bryophytorum TaxID=1436133 RepID=UPI00217696FB|nr:condensation domain-containing protein [Actinacidiphila bryophytorum]UWE08017.1 condensation domain-containing protein [Actinacidiphila bryophytorum]